MTPRNRYKGKTSKKHLTVGMLHFSSLKTELDDPYYFAIRLGIKKKCMKENIQVTNIFKDSGNFTEKSFKHLDGLVVVGKFSNEDLKLLKDKNNDVVLWIHHL